jgi:hypothetical protein
MRTKAWRWMIVLGIGCTSVIAAAGCKTSDAGSETSSVQPVPAPSATSVLLLANMAEAEDSCGCGDIIRSVRAAAATGVRTREVDARNRDEATQVVSKYQLTVEPTVILLDDAEGEVRRFEGESNGTVQALKVELDRLAARN